MNNERRRHTHNFILNHNANGCILHIHARTTQKKYSDGSAPTYMTDIVSIIHQGQDVYELLEAMNTFLLPLQIECEVFGENYFESLTENILL